MHNTRILPFAACAAAALCGVLPAAARAQDSTAARPSAAPPAEGTYVVRRGDTLWGIARQFLGDPFLWPEIYRLNTDVVEDPHWIYPGETLRFGNRPAQSQTVATNSVATRPANETVFSARAEAAAQPRLILAGADRSPPVRTGEFLAAPYVDRVGGPKEVGRVSFIADASRVPRERTAEFTPISLGDIVNLEFTGRVPQLGERYVAFGMRDVLRDQRLNEIGQIVQPVGIIRIDSLPAGQPAIGRIVQQYSRMLLDQGILAMPEVPADSGIRPVSLGGGGQVFKTITVFREPEIASLTDYVIIDATTRDRLRPGDRVAFIRPAQQTESGQRLAESELARAQVIRVTDRATTVLLIGQAFTDIGPGTPVRVVAKMP